ncbi:MAG: GNAT family N-acetyltransferase [Desulfobacteraceae bacterium]
MELRPNCPLDTHAIARLMVERDEMYLIWPKARWPFDHGQWRRALDPSKGHHAFLVMEGEEIIGHAALRATGHPGTYKVSCLYLKIRWRNQGKGQALVALLEAFAEKELCARRLELVVRDYNPRALSCYRKCGFRITGQEGTLVRMQKIR